MKNLKKFLSLAVVAVALSACAGNTCMNKSGYGDTPYESRTAGDGVVVYGDDCYTEKSMKKTHMKKGDKVMRAKARK